MKVGKEMLDSQIECLQLLKIRKKLELAVKYLQKWENLIGKSLKNLRSPHLLGFFSSDLCIMTEAAGLASFRLTEA